MPVNLVKLTACKDGLELDMTHYRNLHDEVIDLLLTLGEEDISDDNFDALWNNLLECVADLKTRIDDLQCHNIVLHRNPITNLFRLLLLYWSLLNKMTK